MKVITICGSLKFMEEMKKQAVRLQLEGYCVLTPVFPIEGLPVDGKLFGAAHFKRIEQSDAIFVVNPAGYIGQATQNEIHYAQSLGKEIIYLEN